MALFTFALLTIFTASLASAAPVAVDNATLLLNGQEALVLNCQFQALQVNDTCNSTCRPLRHQSSLLEANRRVWQMVILLAYRAPRPAAPTAHGRPRHVPRMANHASRFLKSGQTALYVLFPFPLLSSLKTFE